jgi:hypothetical protein
MVLTAILSEMQVWVPASLSMDFLPSLLRLFLTLLVWLNELRKNHNALVAHLDSFLCATPSVHHEVG